MKIVVGLLLATVAGSAIAADLGVKAPPLPTPAYAADSFSGFYIGANFGYGWNQGAGDAVANLGNTTLIEAFKTAPQGFVGGGHAGWGQRFSQYMYWGIEGDVDVASLDGTVSAPGNIFSQSVNSKNRWLASIRGRLGIIPVNHAMLYLTGGYGWGSGEFTASQVVGANFASANVSATQGGGVLGGGIEIPFNSNWLGRVEYLHYFLSDLNMTPAPGLTLKVSDNVDVVRGGISYKF